MHAAAFLSGERRGNGPAAGRDDACGLAGAQAIVSLAGKMIANIRPQVVEPVAARLQTAAVAEIILIERDDFRLHRFDNGFRAKTFLHA